MLTIFITAVVLSVGIVLIIKDEYEIWKGVLGISLAVIAGLALITEIIMAVSANINPAYKYQQDMIQYQTLRYEEENSYLSFSSNVIRYNQKVLNYQTWANNPWTNIFYYDGCENLSYYEINKGGT